MTTVTRSSSTQIEQKTVASFETWMDGNGFNVSSLKLYDDAADFELSHYESGTFATLHTFTDVEQGKSEYATAKKESEY